MKINRGFYKKQDREILDTLTDLKIAKAVLARKINKKKRDNKARIWTLEEYEFLKSNWGKLSKEEIAKKLDRSLSAVDVKAFKIGLKDYFIYFEEITLNELHRLIYGGKNLHSYTLGIWERYKIPYRRTITRQEHEKRAIPINDFLKWFENNKRVIDLSRTEEGFLGIEEPEWLKEKRIADKKASVYGPHNKVWTKEEDLKFIELVNSQKYGYREISIILKRTEGALKRRMLDLKIEKRPPKAYNHNSWTQEELSTVKDLWLKGYQSCVIAEYINRSALAINGILERYKYFGDPPLKFKL
jgi:hypothetical protein